MTLLTRLNLWNQRKKEMLCNGCRFVGGAGRQLACRVGVRGCVGAWVCGCMGVLVCGAWMCEFVRAYVHLLHMCVFV